VIRYHTADEAAGRREGMRRVVHESFDAIEAGVAEIVNERLAQRRLPSDPAPAADLQAIGLNSYDVISVLLAVEQRYAISFNDDDVTPANFQTIQSIARLTALVLARPAAV
jgi:acyl carrier protein